MVGRRPTGEVGKIDESGDAASETRRPSRLSFHKTRPDWSLPGGEMNIDELIARLMSLSEESPRRSATEVLLRNEGFMEIEGASLGRAQLPCGRRLRSPVVIIQARTAHRSPMNMPEASDPPIGGFEEES
jgi:hypothetical protein